MAQQSPPLFIVFDLRTADAGMAAWPQQLADRLHAAGRTHELFLVRDADELSTVAGRAVHAARAAAGAVVAAGPPDVVNAVAQVVWNARLVFGVLPLEAGAGFAVGRALASEPEAAALALLQARVRERPVGLLGDRMFLAQAEVGLLPGAPHADADELRTWRANLASLLGGRSLLTLQAHAQGRMRVLRTRSLQVHCGAQARQAADAAEALAGRELLATTLRPPPLPQALWRATRGVAGHLDDAQALEHFAFERLLVRQRRGGHAMTLRIDGESLSMQAPLVFQPALWPLRLLLPPTELI